MADFSLDIAFMFPHATDESECRYHLGVAYIQANLAKHGFTSKQIIPSFGCTLSDYVDHLISTDAKVVGFTCYDTNYFLIRAISAQLKRRKPNCIVIAGGPSATFSDEILLANIPDIDLCVRFEGEGTTLELISRLKESASLDNLEDISGITYRQGNSIIKTPDRELIGFGKNKDSALDVLPSPYLDGFLVGSEGAGIITARGCTHHCTYCNFSAISKHTIRYHSIDRVINELKCIQEKLEGTVPSTIFINDDDFSINVHRAKKICQRIIDEGIELRLSCLCRADNLDEELIKLLSEAGIYKVIFGLESAVPRVLRNIKKICDDKPKSENENFIPEKRFLAKAKQAISIAKKYKMGSEVSIILGLPGETIEDGFETLNFVRELDVDSYSQNYLAPYRGTELFEKASNYGLEIKESQSLLPYELQYAYPVHEVPFWNNSSVQLDLFNRARKILSAFAGGPDVCTGSENGVIIALIEKNENNGFDRVFRWLSLYLAVGGAVIVLGLENDTIEDSDFVLNVSYATCLPTHRYYYLKGISSKGSEITFKIVNTPLHGKLHNWDPKFPLIKFSRRLSYEKNHTFDQSQSWPIYNLMEKKDVYLLAAIAYRFVKEDSLAGADFWLDGIILDGCQWGTGLCPAIKLRRLFINKDGQITPCMKGLPLGNLDNSIEDLRKKAKAMYTQVRRDRKCDKCPVDNQCPKCLSPDPLSDDEYCNLQKENLDLPRIIARSKMMNIFNGFSSEDL